MTEALADRAREAFAAYRGLVRQIIDELIREYERRGMALQDLHAHAVVHAARSRCSQETLGGDASQFGHSLAG